jgi:hypothetical protein
LSRCGMNHGVGQTKGDASAGFSSSPRNSRNSSALVLISHHPRGSVSPSTESHTLGSGEPGQGAIER